MRYNTGNPIGPDGSNDPRDLSDNAGGLDLAMGSEDEHWTDRLGRLRLTWSAIEGMADALFEETREQADRAEEQADRAEVARVAAEDAAQYDYFVDDDTEREAITGMTAGQRAFVRDTEHVWRYDGSDWIDMGLGPTAGKLDKSVFNAARMVPLPRNSEGLVWGVAVGAVFLAAWNRLGKMFTDHDHPVLESSVLGLSSRVSEIRMVPLPRNAVGAVWGEAVGGILLRYYDASGREFSDNAGAAAAQQDVNELRAEFQDGAVGGNTRGPVIWIENESSEDRLYQFVGGDEEQLSPSGSSWKAPFTPRNDLIRALSDYSTGDMRPHSILLPSREVIPEQAGVFVHIQGTGQSLRIGSRGTNRDSAGSWPTLTPETDAAILQSPDPSIYGELCLMFSRGIRLFTGGPSAPTVYDLTNNDTLVSAYEAAAGVLGETGFAAGSTRFVGWLKGLYGVDSRLLMSISGVGATGYSGLKKGTNAYLTLTNAVEAAKAKVEAAGYRYIAPVLDIVHGNTQSITDPAVYDGYLGEWIGDYAADVMSLNPYQRHAPVATISQMNRQAAANEGVPLAQLLAHETRGNICLVGPQYQHPYYDEAHMVAEGYYKEHLKKARAWRLAMSGMKWECLRPLSVTGLGTTTTTIALNNLVEGGEHTAGPLGPVVLDATLVSDPGSFGFVCSGAAITGVSVGGDGKSIVLTHAGTTTSGDTISYAMQSALNLPTMPPGPNTGSRGCVRDSDVRDRVTEQNNFFNVENHNWLVAFRKPITS